MVKKHYAKPLPKGMTETKGVAVEFEEPEQISIVDISVPHPSPDEILVRTKASAISPGTELLLYRGEVNDSTIADEKLPALEGTLSYPIRYGYASVGTVQQIGSRVGQEWLGQHVFGFHPHASHFTSHPTELIKLPESIDVDTGSFLANVEAAVNFLLDAQPRIGDRVGVFGQGIVGLLTTGLLSQLPLQSLITIEPYTNRRKFSRSMGATEVIDPYNDDVTQSIQDICGELDIAIEVSGKPATLNQAIHSVGYGGKVLIGSWYGTKQERIDLGDHFHRNRLSIESSQVSTINPSLRGRWSVDRRRSVARNHLTDLDLDHLITHRVPVENAPTAYELLDKQPEEAIQILLTYE